jgi:hypothetical protein
MSIHPDVIRLLESQDEKLQIVIVDLRLGGDEVKKVAKLRKDSGVVLNKQGDEMIKNDKKMKKLSKDYDKLKKKGYMFVPDDSHVNNNNEMASDNDMTISDEESGPQITYEMITNGEESGSQNNYEVITSGEEFNYGSQLTGSNTEMIPYNKSGNVIMDKDVEVVDVEVIGVVSKKKKTKRNAAADDSDMCELMGLCRM